jgi:Family of unknown function (DUF6088)
MKIAQKIENQLKNIPEGLTFGYQNLVIEKNEYKAAYKTIERFVTSGALGKAQKGVFYKPKQTVFGALKPSDNELLKQYLFANGQRVAYITGTRLYNEMGLTTQVPSIITIASKIRRNVREIGKITIKPAKSYVDVTNDNYYLLGILDAIKDFNTISDKDSQSVINILTNKVSELDAKKTNELLQYALKYPPRVRALLGAIVENTGKVVELDSIRKSLNPLSTYKYGIENDVLTNISKWHLK